MSNNETALKQIIDRIWREGKTAGLSDKEVTKMIEDAIKQRINHHNKKSVKE